ncbi:myb/SANT-like DNA-binding domain-containing protein 3 isoform X1 [Dermacentor albipictus]|uniref:myb/SANT-like DNA-binding domain-containing protein 3 isoform X1 n=2 Tax=Dermacentor albipictus TaxID=60249 RepID=UPI0038FCDC0D
MPGKLFYSDEEKDLVTELVRKYKFSIENKKSDTVSLSRKMKAWDALTAEFNSAENVRPRTVAQLRKLWDNLKQRWKKEKAKQIRNAMATGGGPPPEPVDERLSQIEAAVPHLSERVKNPYDSDRPPSTQPADSVADIIAGMTQSNPEDSDDDRTLELSSTEYLYVDSANARSPLPADPTDASSEPAQCRQQASQHTQCATTQSASQETAVSRRALLQQTLSTELESRLQALQDERCQRATEHKARMRMMEEEHGWKRLQYADEEKKNFLHRMQLRLLRAKLKVSSMRAEVLAKQLAGDEAKSNSQ